MTDDHPEIDADSFADEFEEYDPRPEDFDAPIDPKIEAKLAAFHRCCDDREQR